MRKGFTLIELLVVIAIIAILAVVVVLTLNPAQLLAQSRDANRVSDIATLTSALNLYTTDQSGASSFSLGTASNTAISIYDPQTSSTCGSLGLPAWNAGSGQAWQCAASSTYRNASSSGWVPVNFNAISAGSPLGSLPVDPVNQTSSGLFYSYNTNGIQSVVTADLESQKYKAQYGTNGPTTYFPEVISGGTPSASLLYSPSGLTGYWNLNEGSGTAAYDQSGNGNNGTWQSGSSYATGKVGPYSANLTGTNYISMPTMPMATSMTFAAWIDPSSVGGTFPNVFANASSANNLFMETNGNMYFQICGTSCAPAQFAGAYSLNTWQFVTETYNYSSGSTTLLSYLNGQLVHSYNTSTLPQTPTGMAIGTSQYQGLIDDFRAYNRALSPAEIQALYNAEK